MAYSRKFTSYLGLALMLSMVSFMPTPSWADCKNSGGSAAGHKVGSQVSGGSVTICASAVSVNPARTALVKAPAKQVAKPAAKPAAKQVAKPVAKVVPKPAAKAVFRRQPAPKPEVKPVPKPVAKPLVKPIAKPGAKPAAKITTKVVVKSQPKVITKPGTTNATNGSANFVPAGVTGSVYPAGELNIGQPATFVAPAYLHYRTGTLLELPTEVRFTPISVAWDFGDGAEGTGNSLEYSFESAGTHAVKLRVTYQVAYRVRGSANWIAEPDTIAVVDDLLVSVSGSGNSHASTPVNPVPRRVLLVGADCLARPGTFGCN